MTSNKLISIITVTYNAREFLEQTILSVLGQTYHPIEYIIVDGGSTDGTIEIIKKYESGIASWISEKDNGIYDAMNKGIRMAKGELIGMINAGDFYEPNAVESVWNASLQDPECGIFHGKINLLDEKGDFIKEKIPQPDLSVILYGMCVYHPTFFVKKSLYETNGLYDTSLKVSADFDFTLRSYLKGVKFDYLDQVIANFRSGGYSHKQSKRAMEEVCISLENNGQDKAFVEKVRRTLKNRYTKAHWLIAGHSVLKKILPKGLLDKISRSINMAD